jgi:hypothetical protein
MAASVIAMTAPRDPCDESAEVGFGEFEEAAVILNEPMAKRPSSSFVIVIVWGKLLLSPVRKKSVVASWKDDAPFKTTVSLSSCTENFPEVASRKPKTVMAVPVKLKVTKSPTLLVIWNVLSSGDNEESLRKDQRPVNGRTVSSMVVVEKVTLNKENQYPADSERSG